MLVKASGIPECQRRGHHADEWGVRAYLEATGLKSALGMAGQGAAKMAVGYTTASPALYNTACYQIDLTKAPPALVNQCCHPTAWVTVPYSAPFRAEVAEGGPLPGDPPGSGRYDLLLSSRSPNANRTCQEN